VKKRRKKKYLEEKWSAITGTKTFKVLKSKPFWGSVVDVLAIITITSSLILFMLVLIPAVFLLITGMGVAVLWEEWKDGIRN